MNKIVFLKLNEINKFFYFGGGHNCDLPQRFSKLLGLNSWNVLLQLPCFQENMDSPKIKSTKCLIKRREGGNIE